MEDRLSRQRQQNNGYNYITYDQEGRRKHEHVKERHVSYKKGLNRTSGNGEDNYERDAILDGI